MSSSSKLGKYRVVFPLGLVKIEEELEYEVHEDKIILKAGNYFIYELSLHDFAKFVTEVLSKSNDFKQFIKEVTKEIIKELQLK